MRFDQIIVQTRSGGALQHPWSALPPRLIPFISAEDKADHFEACTALLPPVVVAEEPVAQQEAVAAAAEPVAQQEAVAVAAAEPVAQQEAVVAAAAEPVAQQEEVAAAAVAEPSALRAAEVPTARSGVRQQVPSVD